MTSFEGMQTGTTGSLRGWRFARYLPLYLAGIAAGSAIGIGLTFIVQAKESPTIAPATVAAEIVAPAQVETPAITLAATFTLELPTAFTDNFDLPVAAPEVAPAAEAVLETPVALSAPSVPSAPSAPAAANPPAASQPVEQPQPAPPAPAPAPVETSNFYLPAVAGGGATNLESRLLEGINAQRAANGLAPYTYDASLSKVARTRSQQMADQGYFGHVDPYGYSMYTELLQRFGIGYSWAGENLALNNYSVSESPEKAMISLMKSPTHAANILAGDFYRVGIGEVTTSDGRHIYAMIFVG